MKTFWIYYGGKVVTGVQAPEGSTDDAIKDKALKTGLCFVGDMDNAPFEIASRIRHGEVRL